MRKHHQNPQLEMLLAKVGNASRLATLIGVNKQAIYKWQRIPADRLIDIEKATGIPREKLRPDLYRR